jgi:hypothetical protein
MCKTGGMILTEESEVLRMILAEESEVLRMILAEESEVLRMILTEESEVLRRKKKSVPLALCQSQIGLGSKCRVRGESLNTRRPPQCPG